MVKSKTKIEKQTRKKTNSILIQTIRECKKKDKWKRVAEILSGPRRNRGHVNLEKISKEKEDLVIPGKVLSQGEITKKKIVALNFSKNAREKITKAGGKALSILEEIKVNPEMRALKILK